MAFLEITAGPLGEGLEGRRVELARPRLIFELGHRSALPIVLPARAVTGRHARIERTGGEWFFSSYGSPGSWLDGEALPPNKPFRLTHGAVLELGRCGVVMTFNEREPAGRAEELERGIADAPDDAQRWLVYGDWLQERGDPWGAELVRGPDAEPPVLERLYRKNVARVRALGPLMRAVWENDVSVQWNQFNAVSHLGLRPPIAGAADPTEAKWLLTHVGSSPAAKLLTSLDLGVATGKNELDEARAVELLTALADRSAPALPALRTLTLGYLAAPRPFFIPGELQVKLAAKSPHASLAPSKVLPVRTTESLRLLSTTPKLFVGNMKPGDVVPLQRLRPSTVTPDKDATFRVIGLLGKKVPRGGARLGWDGACWRVHRESAPVSTRVESTWLRLNHHVVQLEEVLMPGDELEVGPGVRFRFEVS